MNILIFVIILLVLVVVHELGHFFTAKKFGIRVDEFGFGFPPKLFGKKYGETEYTVNLLPIGGFVKIFGEDPNNENTNGPDRERSFVHKAKWKQAIVLVAGVAANFLLAWLLFSFGFMSGLPASVNSEVSGATLSDVHLTVLSVAPDSPAEKAGIKSGDKIIRFFHTVDDHLSSEVTPDTLKDFIMAPKDMEVEIGYSRGAAKNINFTKVTPVAETEDADPKIGISMDMIGVAKLPFFSALIEGMKFTLSLTYGTAVGLYTLILEALQGNGSFDSITGPVGMVGIVGDAYQFGFVYLLSFAGLISVNLAIINLLPFPALDGGRLLFLLIEKIKGSPIKPKIANGANAIGFGILILLMLIVTYNDVVKLF